MDIQELINKISIWSVLLPVVAGGILFLFLSNTSRLIFLLVLLSSVPQLARAIIGRGHTLNYFYNFHIPAEFLLLFFFFRHQVTSRKRVIIFNLLTLFGVTAGAVLLFQYGIRDKFLSEWVCANNIVFTSWMLILLLEIFEDDKRQLSFYQPQMWQLLGLFFYTSCTLVIFSLWHYIMKNRDTALNNLWIIHDIFNTLMYITFTISFILEKRNAIQAKIPAGS